MLKGFGKVFSFTFSQHVKTKGYKLSTILVGLILFLAPLIIIVCAQLFGGSNGGVGAPAATAAGKVFYADVSGGREADLGFLNSLGVPGFADIVYESRPDAESAIEAAEREDGSLVLIIDKDGGSYGAHVLLPDSSTLQIEDAEGYESFISNAFPYILAVKSGLTQEQLAEAAAPVETVVEPAGAADGEEGSDDMVKMVLSMALPYLNIMFLYFMVIFYGQGVANCVVMEKSSKLMDLFLMAVKPGAMVLGKVLAIALAAVIQFFAWILALLLGFAAGLGAVQLIDPAPSISLSGVLDILKQFLLSGMFTPGGIAVSLLITLSGFLLYCALASFGGSLAGKQEDLASTNMLFTMVLLISFFCALFAGGMMDGSRPPMWLNWVPFTSILTAPSQVLLGNISPLMGVGILAVAAVSAVLVMMLAGRLYSVLAMYKGNPPSLKRAVGMLRGK